MIKAYAGVARAPFLLLPFTLVAAGAAAGAWDGAFSWARSLAALIGLVSLHAAVNAFNEASDFRSGIDLETERTPFSGGSGTLPAGLMTARQAFWVGVTGSVIGATIGIYFLWVVGKPMIPIMILGAISVLAYTDWLARAYVGELFAGLGLGALPVVGTALAQGGQIGPAALAASLPAFFMTFNLLLLNEFPDEDADRRGGRRNLVLLLGRRGAAILYSLLAILVPVSLGLAVVLGMLPLIALIAILPGLLLAKPLRWALFESHQPVPIPALGANVIWILATNTLVGAALAYALFTST